MLIIVDTLWLILEGEEIVLFGIFLCLYVETSVSIAFLVLKLFPPSHIFGEIFAFLKTLIII